MSYDRHHGRPKMDKNRPDFTTEEGAAKLKAKLEAALLKQKLPLPDIKIVRQGTIHRGQSGHEPRYDLRSDMVDGWPKAGRA